MLGIWIPVSLDPDLFVQIRILEGALAVRRLRVVAQSVGSENPDFTPKDALLYGP
jgi:hypothetical protein